MKKWMIILAAVSMIYAGRTSQWSNTFMLIEPHNTAQKNQSDNDLKNQFNIAVRPNPYSPLVVFYVGGISSGESSSLLLYSVNGKLVADLSEFLHAGSSFVVWRAPYVPTGLFFARLQSGSNIKTIRFISFKQE